MEKIIRGEFVILAFNIKENKNIRSCTDTIYFNKRYVEKSLFFANSKNMVLHLHFTHNKENTCQKN
jgi:hypothetical protein